MARGVATVEAIWRASNRLVRSKQAVRDCVRRRSISSSSTNIKQSAYRQPHSLQRQRKTVAHVFMAALCNRADHIYFHPVVCSFFFLSSPNLSGWRLDVYHTSTHGVALVRIYDAGLKHAARASLEMQDAKNRQKVAICTQLYNFVGLYRN